MKYNFKDMKYIYKKIIQYSSVNTIYVSSIVYLDIKYQYNNNVVSKYRY